MSRSAAWPFLLLALAPTIPAQAPRPEAGPQSRAWPNGPLEVRLAFPGPIDPSVTKAIVGREINHGEGDRAGRLRIAGARLDDSGRTLVLATDPHPREAIYRLALTDVRPVGAGGPGASLHFSYNLNGVEASWDDGREGSAPEWSAWWPRLDLQEDRRLSVESAGHARQLAGLTRPGRLTLRTLARLPAGKITVRLEAAAPFEATLGEASSTAIDERGQHRAVLTTESLGDVADLTIVVTTGGKPPALRAVYRAEGDRSETPLGPDRLLLPWAPAPPTEPPAPAAPPFAVTGGDPSRGEAVFRSEQAKCAACHQVRGQGGEVGPSLDNQAGRKPADVYRELADPSAEIHPDFTPFIVALKDGAIASGIVRAEGSDAIRVLDTNAQITVFKKADIAELRPSSTSIMPVGLAAALGEQKVRDVIAYLITPP